MKLFAEESQSRNNKFKFRGNYTFKILNDTKDKHDTIMASEYQLASFMPQSCENSLEITGLEKDLYLNEQIFHSTKASNDSFGFALDTQMIASVHSIQETQIKKKSKSIKLNIKNIKHKKNCYNIGRWTEEEHRRFIEAILKYGNEWKSVQRHIKTRSSTQSRSHSQKFFLKIKNYDIFDFKDRKPCISSLNEYAKKLTEKERDNMLEVLISYEYHDMPESSILQSEKLLSKKRNQDFASNSFDYDMEKESLSLSSSKMSNLTSSVITSCSTPSNETYVDEEKKDEFKDQFYNAFLSSRLRRNSFEDNILILYAEQFLIDKARKMSTHKKKVEEDACIGESFIEFDDNIIVV